MGNATPITVRLRFRGMQPFALLRKGAFSFKTIMCSNRKGNETASDWLRLRDYKSGGFSEGSLSLVESMKDGGTQGDCGSDVKEIEAAGPGLGSPLRR